MLGCKKCVDLRFFYYSWVFIPFGSTFGVIMSRKHLFLLVNLLVLLSAGRTRCRAAAAAGGAGSEVRLCRTQAQKFACAQGLKIRLPVYAGLREADVALVQKKEKTAENIEKICINCGIRELVAQSLAKEAQGVVMMGGVGGERDYRTSKEKELKMRIAALKDRLAMFFEKAESELVRIESTRLSSDEGKEALINAVHVQYLADTAAIREEIDNVREIGQRYRDESVCSVGERVFLPAPTPVPAVVIALGERTYDGKDVHSVAAAAMAVAPRWCSEAETTRALVQGRGSAFSW